MNSATVRALSEINRRFYEERAAAFSESRKAPWPGWGRVLEEWRRVRGTGEREEAPAVLDVGCGNGRFASYLEEHLAEEFHYVGLDASAALLAAAQERFGEEHPSRDLLRADLTRVPLPLSEDHRRFDLVVVFGVLHHLPGLATRRRLLRELTRWLAPGGVLALTFWRFGAFERFRKRVIPWEEHNQTAEPAIDPAELEPGDFLLAWGEDGAARRYCHFAADEESAALADGLGLRRLATFLADGESGELNRYHLLTPARDDRRQRLPML